MFGYLYSLVFPALGRFFGILSGIASSPFNTVIDYALGSWNSQSISIDCVNVFTGVPFVITNYQMDLNIFQTIAHFFGSISGSVIKGIGYFFGVSQMPFFLSLLVLFGSFFFSILAVKFIKTVVS